MKWTAYVVHFNYMELNLLLVLCVFILDGKYLGMWQLEILYNN